MLHFQVGKFLTGLPGREIPHRSNVAAEDCVLSVGGLVIHCEKDSLGVSSYREIIPLLVQVPDFYLFNNKGSALPLTNTGTN